jgi:phosphate transport system substrate-binding protein
MLMFYKTSGKCASSLLICSAILLCISAAGCKKGDQEAVVSSPAKVTIQNPGSDTMVVLAQAWAEQYAKIKPSVSVEVSGGGSGAGIAALINGTAEIANSTRPMTKQEIGMAEDNTGKEPQEYVVGYDALAIYVHKDNPLDGISIEQLAEIYGEGGTITKWSQLGIKNPGCPSDDIIRISRQSSSGTYYYFREVLLGKQGDFKLGSRDLHGSKDVVELVAMTPCAIGYSGMRYATSYVKKLKVAKKDNGPPVEASVETVLDGTYPIHRPFYMYSLGRLAGETRTYLEWIYSDTAQNIAEKMAYVPLPQAERTMRKASLATTD